MCTVWGEISTLVGSHLLFVCSISSGNSRCSSGSSRYSSIVVVSEVVVVVVVVYGDWGVGCGSKREGCVCVILDNRGLEGRGNNWP